MRLKIFFSKKNLHGLISSGIIKSVVRYNKNGYASSNFFRQQKNFLGTRLLLLYNTVVVFDAMPIQTGRVTNSLCCKPLKRRRLAKVILSIKWNVYRCLSLLEEQRLKKGRARTLPLANRLKGGDSH